jgi:nucleotide-binding universal stress UspA family protein
MSNPKTVTPQAGPALVSQKDVRLERLLVPIDFSTESSIMVAHAVKLAKFAGARITLLHVVELPRTEINPTVFAAIERIKTNVGALRKRAQSTLAAFGKEVRALGVECTEEVRIGTSYDEILNAAEETAPDLIVIGYKGGSASARLLLGSTTERVMRHARCSVLAVRG